MFFSPNRLAQKRVFLAWNIGFLQRKLYWKNLCNFSSSGATTIDHSLKLTPKDIAAEIRLCQSSQELLALLEGEKSSFSYHPSSFLHLRKLHLFDLINKVQLLVRLAQLVTASHSSASLLSKRSITGSTSRLRPLAENSSRSDDLNSSYFFSHKAERSYLGKPALSSETSFQPSSLVERSFKSFPLTQPIPPHDREVGQVSSKDSSHYSLFSLQSDAAKKAVSFPSLLHHPSNFPSAALDPSSSEGFTLFKPDDGFNENLVTSHSYPLNKHGKMLFDRNTAVSAISRPQILPRAASNLKFPNFDGLEDARFSALLKSIEKDLEAARLPTKFLVHLLWSGTKLCVLQDPRFHSITVSCLRGITSRLSTEILPRSSFLQLSWSARMLFAQGDEKCLKGCLTHLFSNAKLYRFEAKDFGNILWLFSPLKSSCRHYDWLEASVLRLAREGNLLSYLASVKEMCILLGRIHLTEENLSAIREPLRVWMLNEVSDPYKDELQLRNDNWQILCKLQKKMKLPTESYNQSLTNSSGQDANTTSKSRDFLAFTRPEKHVLEVSGDFSPDFYEISPNTSSIAGLAKDLRISRESSSDSSGVCEIFKENGRVEEKSHISDAKRSRKPLNSMLLYSHPLYQSSSTDFAYLLKILSKVGLFRDQRVIERVLEICSLKMHHLDICDVFSIVNSMKRVFNERIVKNEDEKTAFQGNYRFSSFLMKNFLGKASQHLKKLLEKLLLQNHKLEKNGREGLEDVSGENVLIERLIMLLYSSVSLNEALAKFCGLSRRNSDFALKNDGETAFLEAANYVANFLSVRAAEWNNEDDARCCPRKSENLSYYSFILYLVAASRFYIKRREKKNLKIPAFLVNFREISTQKISKSSGVCAAVAFLQIFPSDVIVPPVKLMKSAALLADISILGLRCFLFSLFSTCVQDLVRNGYTFSSLDHLISLFRSLQKAKFYNEALFDTLVEQTLQCKIEEALPHQVSLLAWIAGYFVIPSSTYILALLRALQEKASLYSIKELACCLWGLVAANCLKMDLMVLDVIEGILLSIDARITSQTLLCEDSFSDLNDMTQLYWVYLACSLARMKAHQNGFLASNLDEGRCTTSSRNDSRLGYYSKEREGLLCVGFSPHKVAQIASRLERNTPEFLESSSRNSEDGSTRDSVHACHAHLSHPYPISLPQTFPTPDTHPSPHISPTPLPNPSPHTHQISQSPPNFIMKMKQKVIEKHKKACRPSPSQMDVYTFVSSLNLQYIPEYTTEEGISIDCAILQPPESRKNDEEASLLYDSRRIAIELNGISHYVLKCDESLTELMKKSFTVEALEQPFTSSSLVKKCAELNGNSRLKMKLLEWLGWKAIAAPYWDLSGLREKLQSIIKEGK